VAICSVFSVSWGATCGSGAAAAFAPGEVAGEIDVAEDLRATRCLRVAAL
jgi:hypothetical protein